MQRVGRERVAFRRRGDPIQRTPTHQIHDDRDDQNAEDERIGLDFCIVAGKPWSLKRGPLGGYEKWDGLVTGALVWAGFPDPVATINTVVEDDPDRENNLQILRAWRREFGEANMRLAEIGLKTGGETREILLNKEGAWDSKAVAWRLRFIRDKVIDGMKLTKGRGVGGGDEKYWKVVSVKQGQARGEDELPF